ncbi:MAG: aldolase/citrate lyase family protein [Oscillospiraceae bacterium]|nr:aldolase/citrate lyase family protein [Oscillospiraceae bacterium]
MDKYTKLKEKLINREKVCSTAFLFMDEPMMIGYMVRDELDFLIFDMEHGRFNTENLPINLHTCRLLGVPSIVRVQDTAYHLIAKTIDMGADGIILPRVESLEQLKTALDAICFYPVGKKGYGGYFQLRNNESFDAFQDGRFLFPQIESPKGIEALPAMLSEYGGRISGIIVGPMDMSVMVGTPADVHSAEMRDAVSQVIDICKKSEKSVGVFCADTDDAFIYKEMGANIFWMATDQFFFMEGYNSAFETLAKV